MPVDEPLYPVHLVLSGRPVLVVGAGNVARGKIEQLLAAEALVDVVAPVVRPEVEALGVRALHRRPYRRGEVAGYRLVVTATDDPEVNHQVFVDAEERGVWVNSADDPANCTFILPARVRRGSLLVTVSTAGHSPALASWLRRRLEAELGPEYEDLLAVLADVREEIRAAGRPTEGLDWQSALDSGMLDLVREGHLAEAKERLQACLSSSSA
jgi:precorrin-2 dehydrogenase/sirohydrochlorin ferrochelatase